MQDITLTLRIDCSKEQLKGLLRIFENTAYLIDDNSKIRNLIIDEVLNEQNIKQLETAEKSFQYA